MNVFDLRDRIIQDYAAYVRSFMRLRDPRIERLVNEKLEGGLLWPEPLIQMNPAFEQGAWIHELVQKGVLHEECDRVFRREKRDSRSGGKPLRLHRHQTDAIERAREGKNYVLTTGTGSGKSLSYIVPIVDYVLRNRRRPGIKAIVVYPMNALANSQHNELGKFLRDGYPEGQSPVTFARYTGQESEEQKEAIRATPPDILLTNYVMLELILTRPFEKNLIEQAQGLRFLVFDELHTYRGRQGADVALLMRRVRERLGAEGMTCVGTSATLSSQGSLQEQQVKVAEVATLLFGAPFEPENIIGETLRRATPERGTDDVSFREALRARIDAGPAGIPRGYEVFRTDALSSWLESTFGVRRDDASRRLIRVRPRRIGEAATDLAAFTGQPTERCAEMIRAGLLAGYQCRDPETEFPAFAFRLHQFLSKGDTVYASLEREDARHILFQKQTYVPGDRSRRLFPLAFCRECGQEYYVVRRGFDHDSRRVRHDDRELLDARPDQEDEENGYLYLSTSNPWPDDADGQLERLPEDWLEESGGKLRVKSSRDEQLPRRIAVTLDGFEDPAGVTCHWVPGPFRFCLACGVAYTSHQRSEFAKLTSLGSEGRSTATTILSLSAVRNLKRDGNLPPTARKLLSFTDNRQDASLQAGHLNDFVEIGLLRSALFIAAQRTGGLTHEVLTEKVFEALGLPLTAYAADPKVEFARLRETQRALKEVLGYRLYRDLRRGWRITSPNLEQCGLLEIVYEDLEALCASESHWAERHPVLAGAAPATRAMVARALLDLMRRELAIKVDYLDDVAQQRIRQLSSQHLREPWALDESERLDQGSILFPRARRLRERERPDAVFLSPRSSFGQFLGRRSTFPDWRGDKLKVDDKQAVIADLLATLQKAGLVEMAAEASAGDVPGYRVPASAMRWVAGDGSRALHDPVRVPRASDSRAQANPFFVAFYKGDALESVQLRAREHTAQVPSLERERREESFRSAELPILYCSPTMELGVDISELNVVNMRNIPPTPANYAQRSGRAGRSGQPALVFSYCSTASQHDQYFFKRPDLMVSGAVAPPRLDLANEELVRAHVHGIWLAETGEHLGSSLKEILDVGGATPSLGLLGDVRRNLEHPPHRERARVRAARVLASLDGELEHSDWYTPTWLDDTLARVVDDLDRAAERWRTLFRSALNQRDQQTRIADDLSRSIDAKREAERLRREAQDQLDLLTATDNYAQSDFYSYRYFASEGFLPGYSFPRLPLSAFLPGRKGPTAKESNYLSRPRFLAISEFGPRAIVYHEGSRYIINRVILPVEDRGVLTTSAKLCEACGYLHPVAQEPGPSNCERCNTELRVGFNKMFRLRNVSTKRRDRINSDEEERLRMGYEVRTAVRFDRNDAGVRAQEAELVGADGPRVKLTYGHAAALWRINLGWKRRKNRKEYGFVLDEERGYWGRNELEEDDVGDTLSDSQRSVIPFVEDHRNCLLFAPVEPLSQEEMASLQAALKNAIQVEFQLEETELAAEPLPSQEDRRQLLFYEASEGGAGVLRRLVRDADAFASVVRRALELLHFDPETGADRRRAERAQEDCEAACYDCLMSYTNQGDHRILDRMKVRGLLLELARTSVRTSPVSVSRAEHLQRLLNLAGSELEREWLRHLDARNLRLPSAAQHLFEALRTRPDFIYEEARVVVYIDGPVHEFPERARRDAAQQDELEDAGWQVLRFSHREDWDKKLSLYPNVFGRNG